MVALTKRSYYLEGRLRCACGRLMEGLFSAHGEPMAGCSCGAEWFYSGPTQDCVPANWRAREAEEEAMEEGR